MSVTDLLVAAEKRINNLTETILDLRAELDKARETIRKAFYEQNVAIKNRHLFDWLTAHPKSGDELDKWSQALSLDLSHPAPQEWVEHVYEEGSRRHVISYSTTGNHCSEPNCEVNKP